MSVRGAISRVTIVLSMVVAMCATATFTADHAFAAATPGTACETNSTEISAVSEVRCINHINLKTRQNYLDASCITSPLPPDSTYEPGACGMTGRGAEAIAQARFLNRLGGFSGGWPGGLQPSYQYEVNVPNVPITSVARIRADILFYPGIYDQQPSVMQIIEAKGDWEQSAQFAQDQAQGYVDGLNITESKLYGFSSQHAILGTWAQDIAYTDSFKIPLDECQSGDTGDRYERYTVTAPLPGVLYVSRSFDPCQNPKATPSADEPEAEGLGSSEEDRLQKVTDTTSGGASGDPHMTTIDGLRYDLQSEGEFHLAESSRYGLDVQARLTPVRTWSALDAVAMSVGTHKIELRRNGTVLLDGSSTTIASNETIALGHDAFIFRSDDSEPLEYFVVWPGASDRPVLAFQPIAASALVGLHYPAGPSDLTGLLGNADGNPANDLKLSDGTPLGASPSQATIHGSYANSWRITDSESLFTYDAGKSTASYTDLSFPPSIFTINDVEPSARDLSITACEQQGVLPGPQFDDCVLDVAQTQNNQFAEMASQFRAPLLGVGDARVDANGRLTVDLEGDTVPPNFNAGQLVTDSKLSSFAGPFSGTSTYRFYVPELPPHLHASVSFDLIALGDWSDDTIEKLNLAVDQTTIWTQAFGDATPQLVPSGTGTTDDGTPYTVFRVEVPFDHYSSQVSAVLSATGVDGLANKAFGIDNIQLSVTIVPPEVFDLGPLTSTTPSTVSDGQLNGVSTSGAGHLETMVSSDEYTFSLAQDSPLVLAQSCPWYSMNITHLTYWKIVKDDGSGSVLYSGSCTSIQPSYDLTAGNYRLIITGNLDQPYTASLQLQPRPQSFALGTLTPASPLSVADGLVNGSPAAGAGNWETALSQDQYTFTTTTTAALMVQRSGDQSITDQPWTLVTDDAAQTPVSSGSSATAGIVSLPAGSYRLILGSTTSPHPTGTYTLTLSLVQPQQFDLGALSTTPSTVSDGQLNGVSTSGAGHLETMVSSDEYTFSLAQDSPLVLAQSCPWYSMNITHLTYWKIVKDDGSGSVLYSGSCTSIQPSYDLTAGNYRLIITGNLDQPYTASLQLQPRQP